MKQFSNIKNVDRSVFKIIFCFQKTTQLRKMLESPELEFIMEAHNGLSAKIVQEAGRVVIILL